MSDVSWVPHGCQVVVPHLVLKNGVEAIDFYKNAFGAVEVSRMYAPDGKKFFMLN